MPGELDSLSQVLPQPHDPPPLADNHPEGARYIDSTPLEFVPPPISLLDGCDLEEAQVVVVSAPAAVGKTMLGRHLAHISGGVLWDLTDFRVGSNFAIGTLAGAHGASALGQIITRLQNGTFVVIADSLDEARLRVTFDAFTAFLDDLATQVLKGASPGRPAMVLLGRGETAGFCADWLKDADVQVAVVRIDFFDRERAIEFVDRQLVHQGKDSASESMIAARDAMFDQTLAVLGVDGPEWPVEPARRFLGYAPVLVAVSRYLASGGNPKRLAERLAREGAPEAIWPFLIELIDVILEREREKLRDGFRERAGPFADGIGFSGWDGLFSPNEQCAWLLSEAAGTPQPSTAVPDELEGMYREEVRGWMGEHPFVGASPQEFASPVFEDFVYAKALIAGSNEEQAAVRSRVAAVSYRPTEMLARFAFGLSDDALVIDAADLGVLYESLLTGAEAGRSSGLAITDEEGELLAEIALGDEASQSNSWVTVSP